MPTANRRQYVPIAISAFLLQDYEPRELVIIDDGADPVSDLVPNDRRIVYVRPSKSAGIGSKRNTACRIAHGTVIAHWDDDDWHAPWRLSYQVGELLTHGVDICGLDRLWLFDSHNHRGWRYHYRQTRPGWLAGGTFCYKKSLWLSRPFPEVASGEDTRFIRAAGCRRLAHQRDDFYVVRIHGDNTSTKPTAGRRWRQVQGASLNTLARTVAAYSAVSSTG